MFEKVFQIHRTYLMDQQQLFCWKHFSKTEVVQNALDQQLFCWKHFSKTEVVQNTDLNILSL